MDAPRGDAARALPPADWPPGRAAALARLSQEVSPEEPDARTTLGAPGESARNRSRRR